MATRTVPTAVQGQIDARAVNVRLLVELEFSGSTIRLWNGVGDLSWNGNTFQGVGSFLSVGEIEEGVELRAFGIQLALSGVPSALISAAYSGFYQGRPGRVYLGVVE